jgi:hypothetical protein
MSFRSFIVISLVIVIALAGLSFAKSESGLKNSHTAINDVHALVLEGTRNIILGNQVRVKATANLCATDRAILGLAQHTNHKHIRIRQEQEESIKAILAECEVAYTKAQEVNSFTGK